MVLLYATGLPIQEVFSLGQFGKKGPVPGVQRGQNTHHSRFTHGTDVNTWQQIPWRATMVLKCLCFSGGVVPLFVCSRLCAC